MTFAGKPLWLAKLDQNSDASGRPGAHASSVFSSLVSFESVKFDSRLSSVVLLAKKWLGTQVTLLRVESVAVYPSDSGFFASLLDRNSLLVNERLL